jgi:hypothetical protein
LSAIFRPGHIFINGKQFGFEGALIANNVIAETRRHRRHGTLEAGHQRSRQGRCRAIRQPSVSGNRVR